jgi:ribosome modulation factor
MTCFEEGYQARLRGMDEDDNPYDFDEQPYSHKKWKQGWLAAKKYLQESMR